MRKAINLLYEVKIESYEELLPGNTVRSYATGNREINNGFIVFSVIDNYNEILYHPVFSETVGRELASCWGICLPSKMSVFASESARAGIGGHGKSRLVSRKEDNRKMLQLIQFARSMMILHIEEPMPMQPPFKDIYIKLFDHPGYEVWDSDIKSINTGIKNFLNKPVNKNNENFRNLQTYVDYLRNKYPTKHLKNSNFEVLRNKMRMKYSDDEIVF